MIFTSITALVILLGIATYPFFANHLPNQRQNAAAVIGVVLLGFPILAAGPVPEVAHGTAIHTALMVLSFLFFASAFLGRRRGHVSSERSSLVPFFIGAAASTLDAVVHTPEIFLGVAAIQVICLLAITKTYSNLPKVVLIKAVYFGILYCTVTAVFHATTLNIGFPESDLVPTYILYGLLLASALLHMAFQDFSRTRTKRSWTEQARIDQDLMKMAFRGRRVLKDFRHDLRQPLSTLGILASVGKAISQDPEVTARYQHIQTAQKALKNMLEEFFEELGSTMQYPLGDNPTCLEAVSMDDVLSPLVEEYRMLADVKQLQIRYVPSKVKVLSNKESLTKIIRNGLDNAIKYTNKGGIVVGVRRRRGRLCVQIIDTGSGVENNKVATHNKGWGHGSNIVRDLSEQIQAKTECRNRYSKGNPSGSVFEVMLPSEHEILHRQKVPGQPLHHLFEARVMAFNNDHLLYIQRHLPTKGFDRVDYSPVGAYRAYLHALRKGMASVYIAYAADAEQKKNASDQLKILGSLLDYEPCCILMYNATGLENPQIEFAREMIRIPINPKQPEQSLAVIAEMFPELEKGNSARLVDTSRKNAAHFAATDKQLIAPT